MDEDWDDELFDDEGEEWFEILHSVPLDELNQHILSMMCPCCPDAGADMIYHKEMGDAKPHEYLTEVLRVFEN